MYEQQIAGFRQRILSIYDVKNLRKQPWLKTLTDEWIAFFNKAGQLSLTELDINTLDFIISQIEYSYKRGTLAPVMMEESREFLNAIVITLVSDTALRLKDHSRSAPSPVKHILSKLNTIKIAAVLLSRIVPIDVIYTVVMLANDFEAMLDDYEKWIAVQVPKMELKTIDEVFDVLTTDVNCINHIFDMLEIVAAHRELPVNLLNVTFK